MATRKAHQRASADRTASSDSSRGCIPIAVTDAITRPLKTSETVARDVVRDIIDQGLQPGDGLPSEAAMLEQYNVSRESLREGLRLLEVQGLITIRRGPGGGPIVGPVDPANLGRISTLYFHMSGATYRELLEAWVLSESILAERAARNPDAALRAAVMGPYIVSDEHAHDEDRINDFVRSHAKFHSAIASLAQNRVLELTLQTFGQIMSHHAAVTDDPRALKGLIERDHHQLAKAVTAGHARRARNLMVGHLEAVASYTTERIGPKVDDYIEWQ
jgi:DNA-binding FadR family transcriptional regulator